MKKYLLYLIYVLDHKWLVFRECVELGIFWRGVTHDFSKFSRAEFKAYANHFYGVKTRETDLAFGRAWEHHKGHNAHHWQYHVKNGSVQEMRTADVLEMIADWRAMAKRSGGSPRDYYDANKAKIILAPMSRYLLESVI